MERVADFDSVATFFERRGMRAKGRGGRERWGWRGHGISVVGCSVICWGGDFTPLTGLFGNAK